MKIILIISLLMISTTVNALPTAPGQCIGSNLKYTFNGRGLVYGPKNTNYNAVKGNVIVEFDYICKPFADTSSLSFATYDLSRSHGSSDAYLTNTWGLVYQTLLPRETVLNQGNNVQLRRLSANEIGTDGLLRGSLRVSMFRAEKNGTVGGGAGGSFGPGTNRLITLYRPFNIVFTDNRGNYTDVFLNQNLGTNVYIYDNACSIGYEQNIDVGNIYSGRIFKIPFSIRLACNDAVTVQNTISTKFTNSSSSNVSVGSGSKVLHYVGSDGVKVDMNISDSNGQIITFGEFNELDITEPSQNTYYIEFKAEFDTLIDSTEGNFSYGVNFEITYH